MADEAWQLAFDVEALWAEEEDLKQVLRRKLELNTADARGSS